METTNFTRLVLSGGGPRGLAMLGALHYIHECNGLLNINEYWGTSIGSIMILLLSIGYTPFQVFHQFFMVEQFTDPDFDIQSILETSALCPIETLGNKVKFFLKEKFGDDANPTFLDLYCKFQNKIHIIGANVDKMHGECFDVDTTPNMRIIDAVEISCDLPYIFTRKKYNDQTYVDGGFINNYAIDKADDGINNVLGICVLGDTNVSGSDYIGWIYRLLSMPIMELYRLKIRDMSEKCTNIELCINNISIIEMSPTKGKKINIFSSGYKQCRKYMLKRKAESDNIKNLLNYIDIQEFNDIQDYWETDFGWSDEEN